MQVDRLAQSLMPANLRPLRSMLHATAVEVLLYLTPLHCQDMLDSVVLSLNTVYGKFMQRNPSFDVRRPIPSLHMPCSLTPGRHTPCQAACWDVQLPIATSSLYLNSVCFDVPCH